jgi:hypothetical protein
MIGSGVQLLDKLDELKWIGGDKSGFLTVKNIYSALASKLWKNTNGGWRKKLLT